MIPLLVFIAYVINLYQYVVLAAVILSLLIAFNVVNTYNPFVRTLWEALRAVTEPLLRPIRRLLPNTGGIDFSPLVLWLALLFVIQVVIYGWMIPAFQ